MPNSNPDDQTRLIGVEKQLSVLDYRLTSNESILTEIKNAVVQLVLVSHELKDLRKDHEELRDDFEDRKLKTDPVIENAKAVIARFYGGLAVILMLMAVLSWVGVESLEQLDTNTSKTNVLETRISLAERDLEYYKERVQNTRSK
jgi:cell division protein ZapA (FtsZ GTPase activity inhibitor)